VLGLGREGDVRLRSRDDWGRLGGHGKEVSAVADLTGSSPLLARYLVYVAVGHSTWYLRTHTYRVVGRNSLPSYLHSRYSW
jgi:hypothetical protein